MKQHHITFTIVFIVSLLIAEVSAAQQGFTNNSVLRNGDWYKFKITETGLQKITCQDLADAGINVDEVNPKTIRLFGNGNGMLPERNYRPRPDDLNENAIYVTGEDDGSFDEEDYILFFAENSMQWVANPLVASYNHRTNLYDDNTYYFLTYGEKPGKRIEKHPTDTLQPNLIVNKNNKYLLHELEEVSLTSTGKEWFGESFGDVKERTFSFNLQNIDTTKTAHIMFAYANRSGGENSFELFANNEKIGLIDLQTLYLGGKRYAFSNIRSFQYYCNDNTFKLKIKYNPYDAYSKAWLDFLEVNYTSKLIFTGGQYIFSDLSSAEEGNIAEYQLANSNESVRIWEITHQYNVREITSTYFRDTTKFTITMDSLREFIAWDGSSWHKPEFVKKIKNQNLHALSPVSYIIVTPDVFLEQAYEMALIHEQFDNLSYAVVTTEEIYNEFSSGAQDPSAIRDFVRMIYERGKENNLPRYLLLIGDGSFDPKGRVSDEPNYIPAYQSEESLLLTASYVTDDYYGLLDSTEGYNAYGKLDIGVGRFPVKTVEQAQNAVNKIRHYITSHNKVMGDWRNEIYFVADDQDEDLHLIQAEKLVEIVDTSYKAYHTNKIYLDAYPQVTLSGANRYPGVNDAIDKAVNSGALIVNYTGHGGELGWSDELVLNIPMINNWNNLDNMPLFMTATCEFSRFDNPGLLSGGELVFLNPNGGGVGLFTTTRLAYSQSNFYLNTRFYLNAFKRIDGELPRLGDIIIKTKTPPNDHIKNFTLLGDPALKLAYPQHSVHTTSLIEESTGAETDTLSALSKIIVEGEIRGPDGSFLADFNGTLRPKIYYKPMLMHTMANDDDSNEKDFRVQNRLIFDGNVSVEDGRFRFSAIIPKDIDYNYGTGRIIYYAKDTTSNIDANGFQEVTIGGINNNAEADLIGPDITIYLDDFSFESGDHTNTNPLLIAQLEDKSGINFFGNGIGHDIIATIDGDYANSINLNSYYEPEIDNYTKGALAFQFDDLPEGLHTLELKAWDLNNNSSIASIEFIVSGSEGMQITNLSNYPNPFSTETTFAFNLPTNNGMYQVAIDVYSITGRHVKRFEKSLNAANGRRNELVWNIKSDKHGRLDNGTYVYKLSISNERGYRSEVSRKLVIASLQ